RGEIVELVARAGIAVRLERDHEAAVRPATTRSLEYRRQLPGVMAVVVDQLHLCTLRSPQLREQIEAAADAFELLQRGRDRGGFDTQLPADRRGGQRVEYVVAARQRQGDGCARAVGQAQGEA